jgi:uncharacterized membrane protein SpoIIM required for sporulation
VKRDKGFWAIITLFLLNGAVIGLAGRQFTANNTFPDGRFGTEVLPRATEVPEATRKFAHYMAETETEFLELRVGEFVEGSLSAVFTTSLIAFIFLSVRQRRLVERIEKLEAERRAD